MKVYLAGNYHREWRQEVKQAIAGIEWLEPLSTGPKGAKPRWYLLRDLALLRQADLLFAYITDHSPVNSGTSAEMGYAYALGIPILFVRESQEIRYDFVQGLALSTFATLEEGIEALAFVAI